MVTLIKHMLDLCMLIRFTVRNARIPAFAAERSTISKGELTWIAGTWKGGAQTGRTLTAVTITGMTTVMIAMTIKETLTADAMLTGVMLRGGAVSVLEREGMNVDAQVIVAAAELMRDVVMNTAATRVIHGTASIEIAEAIGTGIATIDVMAVIGSVSGTVKGIAGR